MTLKTATMDCHGYNMEHWEEIMNKPFVREELEEVLHRGLINFNFGGEKQMYNIVHNDAYFWLPHTNNYNPGGNGLRERHENLPGEISELGQKMIELSECVPCYGIVDHPAQTIARFGRFLEDNERNFCIFVRFAGLPETNARRGGWRWHKMGAYYGNHHPKHEYFADEDDSFRNGVWFFHIHEIP